MPRARVTQIYNGVDTDAFRAGDGGQAASIAGCPFTAPGHWLVGTVGRMQAVKDQLTLARAFVQALESQPALRERAAAGAWSATARCAREALAMLEQAGVSRDLAWLPGERADVPDVLRGLDCFVLPSLAEGISNTILEAMASGLPVIATRGRRQRRAGDEGVTGALVPAGDVEALARELVAMATIPASADGDGPRGPAPARSERFSLDAMVAAYQAPVRRRLLAREASQIAAGHPASRGIDHVRNHRHLRHPRLRARSTRACCARMNESQHHRGPDEGSVHVEPGLGFGHRRLVDHRHRRPGSSRCSTRTARVVVVFNGEIYNYQELIPELHGARPRVPHASSDTEVIVHAWEAWGERLRRALPRHVRLRAVGSQPRRRCSSRATGSA